MNSTDVVFDVNVVTVNVSVDDTVEVTVDVAVDDTVEVVRGEVVNVSVEVVYNVNVEYMVEVVGDVVVVYLVDLVVVVVKDVDLEVGKCKVIVDTTFETFICSSSPEMYTADIPTGMGPVFITQSDKFVAG